MAAVLAAGLIELALATQGRGEEGWRAAVRSTAALSVGLFLVVYLASTLRRLAPSPATAWLLANRRYLGVSFAVVHFAHFGSIVALSRVLDASPPLHLAVLGGIGDLLLLAMVATSFDASATWLGGRRWNQLHRLGLHYVWVIFVFTYGGAALVSDRVFPGVAIAALLGALALRMAVHLRERSAAATSS